LHLLEDFFVHLVSRGPVDGTEFLIVEFYCHTGILRAEFEQ